MLIDPKVIEERLKILIGMRATRIKRGANMLVFSFGPLVKIKNYKGETLFPPAYSIHVQCVWRILSPDGIILGFRDFYHPSKELTDEEYDTWEYDKPGNNMFDVISHRLTTLFAENDIIVERICADKYAGFSLYLSNGFELQIIPDHSARGEYWRFLDNTKDAKHFVVFEED